MFDVKESPVTNVGVTPEKLFFQIFLSFKKPNQTMSADCDIFHKLAQIFNRNPRDIYESLCDLAWGGKQEVFMQEYLTMEDASMAVAQASLFAHTSGCTCYLKQEGNFKIKEVKK